MTVGTVRSGLVEAFHPVSAVALDPAGAVVATLGSDIDREFFLRSAPKPIQATVSQGLGANLAPEQLAVAAASHWGFPVHIAHVEHMLSQVELGVEALRCPPDRPTSPVADRVWAAQGRSARERVFHNCSGKHAGMLRASLAQGWSLEYDSSEHPIQQAVKEEVERVSGRTVEPRGVDGCGIPTLRSDVTGLARIYHHLVTDPAYAEAADAAARFVSLTTDGTSPEACLARWTPSVVKGGAEGCIGLGMLEHGLAFAAKSWTGLMAPAAAAVIALMDRLGVIPQYQRTQLEPVARPRVLGGGNPVGNLELLDQ